MAQNAMLGWTNHVRSGVISAGSETTAQPAVNLQSDHGADAWQTASVTSSWFVVDAGSSVSWRALLLARTNLTTSATVRWRIGPRESVVEESPSLLLDGPDTVPVGLACARAGTATRVNASGQIEAVSANTLRWDYDPVTLVLKGLLIEESRTNLFLRSEAIGTAPWGLSRATVTTGAALAPDGTMSAIKLVSDTTAATTHFVTQTPTLADSTVYTWSVYAKAGEFNWVRLRFVDKAGAIRATYYNLTAGTVGSSGGGIDATAIEPAGNGWYRCSMTVSSAVGASAPAFQIWISDTDGGGTINGDGVSGIYLWGAQCEAGAFPTSYIPTTSSAVTRNADVVSVPTGGWLNANEGTIFVEATSGPAAAPAAFQRLFYIGDSGNNINVARDASPHARAFVQVGGVTQASLSGAAVGSWPASTTKRMAFAYAPDDFQIALEGGLGSSDASGAVPTGPATAYIGQNNAAANFWNGHIQRLAYYSRRLSNAQLQALTGSGSTIVSATYDSGTIPAGVVPGYGQAIHVLPAEVSGQYLRVDISDPSNPDSNLRVGLAYGGPIWQPAVNISPSSAIGREQGGTEVVTKGGQEYVTQDWQRRAWDMEMEVLTDDEAMEQIYEMDRIARAGGNVLLIPRPDSPYLAREAVFGRLKETSSIGFHHQGAMYRNWRGRVTERL